MGGRKEAEGVSLVYAVFRESRMKLSSSHNSL